MSRYDKTPMALTNVLFNSRRDLFRFKNNLEIYSHERGRMADKKNVEELQDLLSSIITKLDLEIETSEDYERWKNE